MYRKETKKIRKTNKTERKSGINFMYDVKKKFKTPNPNIVFRTVEIRLGNGVESKRERLFLDLRVEK